MLNNICSGITAEEAARHQQRYPIKRDEPVLVYAWGSGGDLEPKVETSPDAMETSNQQRSAVEVVGKKRTTNKQAGKQAPVDKKGNDKAGDVKPNDTSNQADADQATIDAAVAKKKAKKAAKKARKAARNLEDAKPPVGKQKERDSEDEENDSDWTQTSWSPSWASDSENDEK